MATKAKRNKRKPNKREPKSSTFGEVFKKIATKPGRWLKTKIKIGAEGRKKKRVSLLLDRAVFVRRVMPVPTSSANAGTAPSIDSPDNMSA
jgi:hypothetical protein